MSKRKDRRQQRKRQLKINSSLKKKLCKDAIFAVCVYCKKIFLVSDLTIEHIVPRSYGGTNDDSNIALACAPCNHQKGREAWFVKKTINSITYNVLLKNKQYR